MKLRPEPFQPLIVALVGVLDNCAELYLNPREEQGPPTFEYCRLCASMVFRFEFGPRNPFDSPIEETCFGIDDWDDIQHRDC